VVFWQWINSNKTGAADARLWLCMFLTQSPCSCFGLSPETCQAIRSIDSVIPQILTGLSQLSRLSLLSHEVNWKGVARLCSCSIVTFVALIPGLFATNGTFATVATIVTLATAALFGGEGNPYMLALPRGDVSYRNGQHLLYTDVAIVLWTVVECCNCIVNYG
jgi:hypothetical protein